MLPKQTLKLKAQKDIVRDFLDNTFGFFEISEGKIVKYGTPVKGTYLSLIKLYKKHVPGLYEEVKRMSVEVKKLYLLYQDYHVSNRFQGSILKRQQFSRVLNELSLMEDGREIIIYRRGRDQNLFVFPLPPNKKN